MEHETALSILRHNLGFSNPDQWVDYAILHRFRRVKGTPVPDCPDCGCSSSRQIGQYIYYSSLIKLKMCKSCRLIWADAHIDPQTVKKHFDIAYKDLDYFINERSATFRHLSMEITRATPTGGKVLDIGGAMGHLMNLVKQERPDITPVVHDLSEVATRYAAEKYQLSTICGDLTALESHDEHYDAVVLSDVLYYEPNLARFWALLPKLVTHGGFVIIRGPNKLVLIRTAQILSGLLRKLDRGRLQNRIKYFNPEHIYILSRKYLSARLESAGFESIKALPSPMLFSKSRSRNILNNIYFQTASAIRGMSAQKLILTPSMVLIAKRRGE